MDRVDKFLLIMFIYFLNLYISLRLYEAIKEPGASNAPIIVFGLVVLFGFFFIIRGKQ